MTILQSAEELYQTFLTAGQIRSGKPEFSNDSGYWTGGQCNWGGGHVLKTDCETIIRGLSKISSLEGLKQEIQNCSSQSEFDNKKRTNLNKCNELISDLNNRSSGSCAFGICIIWSDNNMNKSLQRVVEQMKTAITDFKKQLESVTYQTVKEISRVSLEVRKIKQEMQDLRRKAQNERDPTKRAQILALIDEKGKDLVKKESELAKLQKKLNFDADKHVADFIEGLKASIEGRHRSGGGNSSYNNPSDPLNNKKIEIINRIKHLMSSVVSDGQLNLELGEYKWENCITQVRVEIDLQSQEQRLNNAVNRIKQRHPERDGTDPPPQSDQNKKEKETQLNYFFLAIIGIMLLFLLMKQNRNREYYE